MNYEFTAEEIRDAARTARIYCPSFTEDKLESLIEMEKRIADSGYLETVQGLIRLEKERGISCTKAIDTYKELLHQKAELERQIPDFEKRLEDLAAQVKQAAWEYE